MATREVVVLNKDNKIIGYTEYNSTVDAFGTPIFKNKKSINKWHKDKSILDKSLCRESINVILKTSYGKVTRTILWNRNKGYGFIDGNIYVENHEWTND